VSNTIREYSAEFFLLSHSLGMDLTTAGVGQNYNFNIAFEKVVAASFKKYA
jgi:hypothetical protein